jgi:predicted RNA-binding Zn ribbon-like protein
MAEAARSAANVSLLGGSLCLDFANTADYHASDHPQELLTRYADLVEWSQHVGLLAPPTAAHLLREASRRPADAALVLEQAIALRETIYRIFAAIAHGNRPRPDDLGRLSAQAGHAFTRSQIVESGEGFRWEPLGEIDALDQMLYPIARSAAELLTSRELGRVRQCADAVDGCGWLFIDTTRNRSRRWCDMRDCGNRAKARRFLERQRQRSTDNVGTLAG